MTFDKKQLEVLNRKYKLDESQIRFIDIFTENLWDTLSLEPDFDILEFISKTRGLVYSGTFYPTLQKKSTKDNPYMINLTSQKCKAAPYRLNVAKTLTNEFFFDEDNHLLEVFNGSFIEDCRYYFACSLLMCKKHFFNAWLGLSNKYYEKNLYKKNTIISLSLSKLFNVSLEEVKKWQNILRDEFILYKREKNNEEACPYVDILGKNLRNQIKSIQIDNIVKDFGGMIIVCKNTQIYPRYITSADNNFAILLNHEPDNKTKKREFIRQLCNFFFENEATESEMDLFADSFGF